MSITVDAGEHIGLVGPSGKGKSTLASTLVRLQDVQAGRVTLGGVDVREIPLGELRDSVAFVEQTSTLFRGSVLDNLRVGNPDLSEEEAMAAMRAASIGDIDLGTSALALSGGQKQRVCLARALARRPRVLVLDEATSHQDALNQAELSRTLSGLRDTTVIIIAHRRAALSGVDRVVELA
ncbi:ABC transporter, ATP-binding protein [Corynebacterium efficiens YS-314]|uniref:ABC transporter ATP-binding protein n=1 Tax=Corynebacterium efficiens TaxID=152794 RepID=UPI0001B86DAB|nr:ABC transporter ATP-binding protein [Corynebacterium efficiens]EEW49326.1 ABC transporter, ATP-binding protein [Corynebacterium efficiens YS-314]